ncbi:MAG: hypothetical protein Q7R83_03920 [bacterium]|nr:hypothetical protein [bacterium]
MALEKNPSFLKQKFNLQAAPEVEAAARRTRRVKKGGQVKETAEARIQNYLDRMKELVDRKNPVDRERGIETFKRFLYQAVIKREDIPASYFETQKRLAREQGHGDIELTDEIREADANIIVRDQQSSIDMWADYLTGPDAKYPDWLKYFALRSVLGLAEYDKEKNTFSKRSKNTIKLFPDLNYEALAYVMDAIQKKFTKEAHDIPYDIQENERAKFNRFLQNEDFAKLYAWAIQNIRPIDEKLLKITEGKWVTYPQGSDFRPLTKSIQGKGTGWCTAGESTAKAQLETGDFYVYYSLDESGEPKIPRAAIRMEDGKIAEVRGIVNKQNLDPWINDVVQNKLSEFPDGKTYEKRVADMKKLTDIDNKSKANQPLTKNDLIFLYEINGKIESLGYVRDPRIQELRLKRNPKEDAPIVMECQPNEIAWRKEDVNENTKAYIGPLFNDIFKALGHLEHIYTSFPEGRMTRYDVQIGGQSEKQLEDALKRAGFQIGDYALQMMQNKDFQTAKEVEQNDLVRLSVQDLFHDQQAHTTDEVYKRAEKFGLELCPAEVGPHLRLKLADQPMGDWFYIAMKQIADADGGPSVFRVSRDVGGLWLNGRWAGPARLWDPAGQFVFRLRK